MTGKRSDTADQTQRRTLPCGPDWIAGHNNARTFVAIDLIGHDVLFVHNAEAREVAEREVAGALVNGHDLRRISEERGVSIETARSQLKAVFRKTGAPSQNDLIRLAVKANPPIRGTTPDQGQD